MPSQSTSIKRSTARRGAFAILVGLPVGGIVLQRRAGDGFMGAIPFVLAVMLFVWLAAVSMPPAGSPPVARRFGFTIRDLN
jgi:hypothetical protein